MTVTEFLDTVDKIRHALVVMSTDPNSEVVGVWLADTYSGDYPECWSTFYAEDVVVIYEPKTNTLYVTNRKKEVIHSE